jgi:putative flavoprotein involved in K+ transport
MRQTETIIIGAGQAGLAISSCLTRRGADHLVLERGRIAQRWADRWESLRLLSPNWMTRLPGYSYQGPEPDGFMTRDEVVNYLTSYARSFDAPVQEDTTVRYVGPWLDGWRVITDRGVWLARNVVIATGHCDRPALPPAAASVPAGVISLTSTEYRSAAQLPDGGVLVVGGSATGVQLARELRRSGRDVVLAVGRHTRLPRRYRGRDIFYWLDRIGSLRRPLSDMLDQNDARTEPSLQLAASEDGRSLDLAALAGEGVRLSGRLQAFDGARAVFADDLGRTTADAQEQLRRVLDRINRHISAHGLDGKVPAPEEIAPVPVEGTPRELDLGAAGIRSVLWATGYTRSYPWLHAPVLDRNRQIIQTRGRTPMAGLYTLGLQFMIRRNSSFIDGVGIDAEEIAAEIAARRAVRERWAA